MAIAHICIGCGLDLARIRPQRDPHYGLPLIICTGCGRAAVRRRHPLQRGWRSFRRIDLALLVIGLQLAAAAFSGAMTISAAVVAAEENFRLPRDRDTLIAALSMFAGIALFNGIWLTFGFAHLRRSKVWLGWTALLAALLLFMSLLTGYFGHGPGLFGSTHIDHLPLDERLRIAITEMFLPMLMVVVTIMVVAIIGIIPGRFLTKVMQSGRRMLWRDRRRRLRARRTS